MRMVLLVVVGWLVSSGSDADAQRVVSKGGSVKDTSRVGIGIQIREDE